MVRAAYYKDKRNIIKQYPHTKQFLKRKGILMLMKRTMNTEDLLLFKKERL